MEIDYFCKNNIEDMENIHEIKKNNNTKNSSFNKSNRKSNNNHVPKIINCIKNSNYETIMCEFEKAFINLFLNNNENLKILKIFIEENNFYFEEAFIPIELYEKPFFILFKNTIEKIKNFILEKKKKKIFSSIFFNFR
jgi:hypothetical protein